MDALNPRVPLPLWFCSLLLSVYPFLAGPIHAPITQPLDQYLTRACVFFGLFFCWAVLRKQMPLLTNKDEPKKRKTWRKAGVVLLMLCTLLGLQLFLLRFGDLLFYLCLFALGAGALASAMSVRQRYLYAALSQIAYCATCCAISFALDNPVFTWSALFFGLSLGFAATLPILAQALLAPNAATGTQVSTSNGNGASSSLPHRVFKKLAGRKRAGKAKSADTAAVELLRTLKQRTILARAYALCVVLAPFTLASMCYLGKLPMLYIFAFALIPYAMPLLVEVRRAEQGAALFKSFCVATTRSAALFLLILIALGIVVRATSA